jgi:RNA polymerase sigma-70 factor (ECF subfamily)
VLDWHASEIAHLLELSVSAVNSALHRARVTLEKHYHPDKREIVSGSLSDTETSMLLSRYVNAWETDDVAGLVALLKEDAVLNMPPYPSWYRGREAIRAILQVSPFRVGMQKRWRLSPTHANGQPAFALYRADESKATYRAYGLKLITIDHSRLPGQITEVTIFHLSSLVTSFGLPPELPV